MKKKNSLKQQCIQGIQDMFTIWKNEFRTIFHDQGVLIFFVIVPLFYPLIYAFIYTNETIRDVPAAVVDNSRSSLSREFLRKVDATPDVAIACYCTDMEEAKEEMRDHRVHGIIYIPDDFSDKLARNEQAHVSLFCDMSGLLYYKALLTANTNVSLDMNSRIKIERSKGTTKRQDEITAYPMEYSDISIYNPANGFAAFLIPAVLMVIIQQTLLLGIGLAAGTAREQNRFTELVPVKRHPYGTLRIVLGKGLTYFMLYAVICVYIVCVIPHLFSLPQIALPDTLALFMLPYLAACICFAMTLSILIRHRETCMLLFVFTSVPLLFLSGISWPGSAIPDFWRYFSYLFPSTFGVNGYVRINSMGANLQAVAPEYQALWIQAGVYFITACLVYRRQISRSRLQLIARRSTTTCGSPQSA